MYFLMKKLQQATNNCHIKINYYRVVQVSEKECYDTFKKLLLEDIKEYPEVSVDEIIKELFQTYPKELLERKIKRICKEGRRTRDYKIVLKDLRKKLYYKKRVFLTPKGHISLIEREGEGLKQIIERISSLVLKEKIDVIADYGSGLFPTTLKYWPNKPKIYIAIDNNKSVIEELKAYFKKNLTTTKLLVVYGDLSIQGPEEIIHDNHLPLPELSLYNRILHVLTRTKKTNPMELIERTPSKIIVVTEPRRSLVRGIDITSREKKFLLSVLKKSLRLGYVSSFKIEITPADVLAVAYK